MTRKFDDIAIKIGQELDQSASTSRRSFVGRAMAALGVAGMATFKVLSNASASTCCVANEPLKSSCNCGTTGGGYACYVTKYYTKRYGPGCNGSVCGRSVVSQTRVSSC
jgi:uncharacterized protein YbcC (UPF0753/DUF2309 family)